MGYIFMNKRRMINGIISPLAIVGTLFLFACGDGPIERLKPVSPFENLGEYEIKIKRSKKDPRNPLLTESLVTETLLKANVLSRSADSTVLKWNYGKSTIVGGQGDKVSEEDQKAINIYEGLSFDLVVQEEEVYLKNYNEVRAELENLFLDLYGNDSITEGSEMYARVRKMFEIKAGSPVLMLENFFPEISLLFSAIEEEYNVGDNLLLDSVANPYGEGHMQILSSVKIEHEEEGMLITKFDSIPQELLDEKVMEYLNKVYGPQATSIPAEQIPKTSYLVSLEVELTDNKVVKYISTEKQFSYGEGAMVNVLEIIIE